MTRRTLLPSDEDIQLAIKQITEITGKPPTALALARHLGLANTTFRRHFPGIAAELTQQRSLIPAQDAVGATRFDQLKRENAELRRDNHNLTEHLDLAVANIQRLTLENNGMRQQLEDAINITRIDTPHRPGTSGIRPS